MKVKSVCDDEQRVVPLRVCYGNEGIIQPEE